MMGRVKEHLHNTLRNAALYNPDVQIAPVCILWPDRDRQWEAVIPVLQAEMPELLVLGNYDPQTQTGPAIWLRCVMSGKIPEVALPKECVPIIYLPGVSRQDLRVVGSCPEHLKPLVELQFRGIIWSQVNAKDWTILAYLKSDEGGIGLDVAQDNASKNALQVALSRLLDEEIDMLRGKHLDKDYFNTLLTGGDPVRDMLLWLDQADTFRLRRSEDEWRAFLGICTSQFGFNPMAEGTLGGAAKMVSKNALWKNVWERFCEAPMRYPGIPVQIRKCKLPVFDLLTDAESAGSWPQWNESQENALRQSLMSLSNLPVHNARIKILELEKHHSARRNLVWSQLGEAPLARALEHLAVMADITTTTLAAGTVDDLADGYCASGWKVDDAVLHALMPVEMDADYEAVATAIRSVYLPWAEKSARYLQKIWVQEKHDLPVKQTAGNECVLFVDGLRFDCAKRLAEMLVKQGMSVEEKAYWAALPSLTGTGKPAVAPINRTSDRLKEEPEGNSFEILSTYQLRKAIEDSGYDIPEKNSVASYTSFVNNSVWLEFGNIDVEGHSKGWKLAKNIDALLGEILGLITSLMAAGWENIRVVTDHGWLLLPQGLPKVDLPTALVESKWGRCATLKPGASSDEMLYTWYWNPNHYFALADGISCYKKGEEFAHGGLSLQECMNLEITISQKGCAKTAG